MFHPPETLTLWSEPSYFIDYKKKKKWLDHNRRMIKMAWYFNHPLSIKPLDIYRSP